jgi:curved DNA-binding protein CbpA
LPDYYAILGLDSDASPENVKVAYRRLVRRYHPDLAKVSTEAQKASMDARMAQLNEAYSVLSNPRNRREYDEQTRLEYSLAAQTASRTVKETRSGQTRTRRTQTQPTQTAAGASAPSRMRPRFEANATVVTQFTAHLRKEFVSKASGFSWSGASVEGFDWGVEAVSWSTSYCVAVRGFASIDSAIAKKIINYADAVIVRHKRTIRKSHFLFLLPFVELDEWESVSSQIQAFLSGKNSTGASLSSTGIVLLDMTHARTLRLGCRFADKNFEQLVESTRSGS